MTAAPCLLPEPAGIRPAPGLYRLDGTVRLSPRAERGERVAAEQIQAALAARGVHVPVETLPSASWAPGGILLAVAGRDRDLPAPSLPAPEASPEPHPLNGSSSPEAYRLAIRPEEIVVTGASPAGLAQGTRTLLQLLAGSDPVPCLTIDDAPALPWRGVMLDISRGKVPTLDTLRTLVDVAASFKLNMLQLYTENTFAFPGHPDIGAGWGAMTPEEVRALDAYCRDRYVELVPCFQSLGHHRRLLALPEYAHLRYSPEDWTLAPGEETWRFLEELYDDLLPCFTSRYVNVCCDEPFDLTHTTPLSHEAAVGYAGGGEAAPPGEAFLAGTRLYLAHVRRLHAMLRARGRTMMLWDDIFQQAPDLLAEMPEDAIFLCWFYEAAGEYPQPEVIRRAGRRSLVCPGTSSWNTLAARLDNARANIRRFVRSGLEAGSIGVLTTDWGDNGHPNFLGASWYGFAYGGSEGWSPGRLPDAEFERRFARLHFGPSDAEAALEALRLMSAACTLPGINRMNGSCTRAMFFRDPLDDELVPLAPDGTVEQVGAMGARALEMLAPLRGVDAERARTLAEMRLAARQIVHAAAKTLAGRRLTRLAEGDGEGRRQVRAELDRLKRELHELRWEYQRLWLARNRPEGIWLSLDQFDTSAAVLDRWRTRVAPSYTFGQ